MQTKCLREVYTRVPTKPWIAVLLIAKEVVTGLTSTSGTGSAISSPNPVNG